MQKFTRAVTALGLIAAIAAVGPPVTAQAQNPGYHEAIVDRQPVVLENVLVVIESSAGLDTIGTIVIELVITESPIPAMQIAEAPTEPQHAVRDSGNVWVSTTYTLDQVPADVQVALTEPAFTVRIVNTSIEAVPMARMLRRSSMPNESIVHTNSPPLMTSIPSEQNALLHLNL